MSKLSNDQPEVKVLKTGTTKTLSGKSTLTYQVGIQDNESVHVRISKNTGGGFFSNEWISMKDIQAVLEEHPEGTPVTSFMLQPIFSGKSVNTPGFVLSVLVHEKLLRPMKGKKRSHEPAEDFTARVETLMSSNVKTKATVRKTVSKKTTVKKAVTKKAAVKKRASIRRKKAST